MFFIRKNSKTTHTCTESYLKEWTLGNISEIMIDKHYIETTGKITFWRRGKDEILGFVHTLTSLLRLQMCAHLLSCAFGH